MYYDINVFFWYKSVFVVELLAAEALLVLFLPKRKGIGWRIPVAVLCCEAFALALPVTDNPLLATVLFLAIFGFSLGAIRFCFDTDWRTIIFCGIAGYTIQHMANQCFDLFLFATGIVGRDKPVTPNVGSGQLAWLPVFTYGSGQGSVGGNIFVFMFYAGIYLIVYYLACRCLMPFVKQQKAIAVRSPMLLAMVGVIVLFDVFFSAIVTYHSQGNLDRGYIIMLDVYNIACCMFSLFLQFNTVLVRKLEKELDIVNRMWEQRKVQYDITKENIDLINIKCHDLKHQIRNIARKEAIPVDTIHEIESVISVYDSNVKTGNDALDVILTEKRLIANYKQIELSCIADGKLLVFMNESDIYSLFGNLLDNAMEAVSKLHEENRVVGLSVKRVNQMVFVNVYNCFEGNIVFRNGLPITTKGNSDNHGYGLKSVELLAAKYGGKMNIKAEDGVFSVSILFSGINQNDEATE